MKKFKLMGITLLASSVLLSSCMFLLPKKKTSSTNTSDPTSSSSQTSEPSSENWSDSILAEMKQYLDGETIPFIKGTWQWAYDDDYGCYSGVSTDTSSKVAIAAFDTSWNKEVDDEGESGNFTRIKTKGVVEVMAYEYENKTYVDGYFIEEFSDWDAETKQEMQDAFGEVLPFPAGTWSALMMDSYGGYFIQSGHSYNYSSMKTLYQNKGYDFFEEEGEEYYYKKLGDYYLIGYFYENTNLKVGYDAFYLDTEPPFEDEFTFSAEQTKALVNEDVTFTVTRGSTTEVAAVQYTVSPTTAATLKSSDNNGCVFTIKEAGTIVFTATQGELTSSFTLTAYTEYPKPTSISFKKSSYDVLQGDKLDLSEEIVVLPEGAEGTITYSVTGNSGVTVSSAGLVTVAQTASTSSDATVTARYSETVYGTCTIKVKEKAQETTVSKTVAEIATANSWEDQTQHLSFKLDTNVSFSLACQPASGQSTTNSGKYYTNGNNWRLYASESCVLTISVPSGHTIKSITLTFEAKNDGTLLDGTTPLTSATAYTVNKASIDLSVGAGQIRISAISVTYA